jgi:hypothetical protein
MSFQTGGNGLRVLIFTMAGEPAEWGRELKGRTGSL